MLAHRLGRRLVVADGAHHPPPGRAQRQFRQQHQRQQHGHEQPGVAQLDPDPRRGRHVHPPARRPGLEAGIGLQVQLVRDRARDAGHVEDAARQPAFVSHHGDDDLADPQRRDGEIVRPKPQRDLAHGPGGSRRQQPAHRPAEQHGQAKPADVARLRGVVRLDRHDGGVEQAAIDDEARGDHRKRGPEPPRARQPPGDQRGQRQRHQPHDKRQQHPGAAGGPRARHVPGGHQHRGQAAKRQEAHDARVEQARIAPGDVDPQRHDRGQKPHVQDAERAVPAAREHGVRDAPFQQEQDDQNGQQGRGAPPARRIGLTGCGHGGPLRTTCRGTARWAGTAAPRSGSRS